MTISDHSRRLAGAVVWLRQSCVRATRVCGGRWVRGPSAHRLYDCYAANRLIHRQSGSVLPPNKRSLSPKPDEHNLTDNGMHLADETPMLRPESGLYDLRFPGKPAACSHPGSGAGSPCH